MPKSEWQLGVLPSNKEGKSYKAFAERRLQVLSPEISPSVIPKLYRTHGWVLVRTLVDWFCRGFNVPQGVGQPGDPIDHQRLSNEQEHRHFDDD